MSAQSPWRPPQARAAQSPPVHAEIESSPRRWPVALLVVVALLAGLGLGNVLGTSSRDLDAAEARLEQATATLEEARAEQAALQDRLDAVRATLTDATRQQTVAEEGVEALGKAAVADGDMPIGHDADLDAAVRATVGDWTAAWRAGDRAALRRSYADGATTVFSQNRVRLLEVRGALPSARATATGLPADAVVTRTVQEGQFAALRYTGAESSGVVVLHVVDGRVAQQWVFLDGVW